MAHVCCVQAYFVARCVPNAFQINFEFQISYYFHLICFCPAKMETVQLVIRLTMLNIGVFFC